jgi:alpha-beta hydrolase superfamily lysophospholipase
MLILHGEKDRLTSPRASQDLAQTIGGNVTFKLWPASFHELHHEPDQDDVFKTLINWLYPS